MRPIVRNKYAEFRDPCFNRSPEIPYEAFGDAIFNRFFRYNFPLEVDNDVISCAVWLDGRRCEIW